MIRDLIPLHWRRAIVQWTRRAKARAGRWRHECSVCGARVRAFEPAGLIPRVNAQCPDCGALERHRLLWLYLRPRVEAMHGASILHIAPEPALVRRIAPVVRHYVRMDYAAADVDIRADITRLAFADATFDVVVCSHVLEHIPDDARAMTEIRRVLKPDGWAILQVPLDEARASTFENHFVTDPAERERLFGQHDHVRVYGRDYEARLRAAGLCVTRDDYAYRLSSDEVERFAIVREPIFLCTKAPANVPARAEGE